MSIESTIEKIFNSEKEVNSNLNLITFKIIDGLKQILEDDRRQKQPLILSMDEERDPFGRIKWLCQ